MTLNVSKAAIALAALASITVLLVVDAISRDAGLGLLGMIVGYATGNGIAAHQGISAPPIISPRPTGADVEVDS